MRGITESDVVEAYLPRVLQVCKNAYKGLEMEDRLMEGRLAVLHAIRTYKKQYGCFENYMLQQLSIIMKQKNKEAWAVRRLDSRLSLDAELITENDTYELSQYFGSILLDDTEYEVNCFIEGLSDTERHVLHYLIGDYSITSFSNKLELSTNEMQSVIECLKSKAASYFMV